MGHAMFGLLKEVKEVLDLLRGCTTTVVLTINRFKIKPLWALPVKFLQISPLGDFGVFKLTVGRMLSIRTIRTVRTYVLKLTTL